MKATAEPSRVAEAGTRVQAGFVGLRNPHSAVFDALARGKFAKVIARNDNEWGYACCVVDLVDRLSAMAWRESSLAASRSHK